MDKKNKKKNLQQDTETNNLNEELNNYLKINEPFAKAKEFEESEIARVKEENNSKIEEIKKLKEEGNIDKIYDISLQLLKQSQIILISNVQNKIKLDNYDVVIKDYEIFKQKFEEKDKFGKLLMEKIKGYQEEISNIRVEEDSKRREVIKKCEDFMQEVQNKIEAQKEDRENLIKENTEIREKLKEAADFIKEHVENNNIKSQSMQMEQEIKNMMQGKLLEITEQAKSYMQENIQLKSQLNIYSSKYEELNKSIQQYNSLYENLKSQLDKRNIENAYLTKKYEDTIKSNFESEASLKNIQLELEKKDKQLGTMTSLNRNLSEQVKALKEKTSNI